tara:strand:+ start:177 stop:671 length:495 start_codon:yes stop_codon:yes gene_type:complete
MAHSTVVKNFRDGTVSIADGAGSPATHTIAFEAGDFSISGLLAGQKETTTYLDRGDLGSVRHTNQTFPTGSMSFHLTDITDAGYSTAIDLMLKKGSHASAVSTLGATAEVYAVKLTLTIEESDHSGGADHTIVLDDCVCSVDIAEGDPSSVSISFTCYGTITLT